MPKYGAHKKMGTREMYRKFLARKNAGVPIAKIAKEFGLARSTVYYHLGEIAKMNNLHRDDLLFFPNMSHHHASETAVKSANKNVSCCAEELLASLKKLREIAISSQAQLNFNLTEIEKFFKQEENKND